MITFSPFVVSKSIPMRSPVRQSILVVVMAFMAGQGMAQDQNFNHNRAIMERIPAGSVGGTIALGNLSYSPAGTVGDVYLYEEYRTSTFWLYDGDQVVQGLASRLDMQRNEFDINLGSGKGIRALPGSKVRSMTWTNMQTNTPEYFINAGEYKNDKENPYNGFFQIMSEGEITLHKLNQVVFKPADKNPTHSTGSKDNRFIKSADLYYAIGTKALKLPGRKGILKLLESQKPAIDKFIEVNDLNLGKEWHLVQLFDHYNSLVKK